MVDGTVNTTTLVGPGGEQSGVQGGEGAQQQGDGGNGGDDDEEHQFTKAAHFDITLIEGCKPF